MTRNSCSDGPNSAGKRARPLCELTSIRLGAAGDGDPESRP
jgi:hypothetical protein